MEVDEPELGSAPPPPITGLSMTVSAPTKTKSSVCLFFFLENRRGYEGEKTPFL